MNIFFLDKDPIVAAQSQCDKHVVKMILEYAQLLSTAQRICDGKQYVEMNKTGKVRIKRWKLKDSRESVLYKATHVNHPSNIWTRESKQNYEWLYQHFCALCDEYTHRYHKVHESDRKLRDVLATPPKNIPDIGITPIRVAIDRPDCLLEDPIESYRAYYHTKQQRFKMVWTNRKTPEWFTQYANV
jgi:hypothetical protein